MKSAKGSLWFAGLLMAILACNTLLQPVAVTPTLTNIATAPSLDLTLTAAFAPLGGDLTASAQVQASPSDTPTLEATATFTPRPIIPTGTAINFASTATPVVFGTSFGFTPLATSGQPTATLGPSPTPGPTSRSGPSVTVVPLLEKPPIDGYLDDWAAPLYAAYSPVGGLQYFSGAGDISAEFRVAWDTTYLYLGAVVHDNQYVQNATGSLLLRGDAIEILLDTNVSQDYAVAAMNGDDFQLGLSGGASLGTPRPEAYLLSPLAQAGPQPLVELVVLPSGDGYFMEAAIPWSVFGIVPSADMHFGFAFSVSDNDSAGTSQQQTLVSIAEHRRFNDPTTWIDLHLIGP